MGNMACGDKLGQAGERKGEKERESENRRGLLLLYSRAAALYQAISWLLSLVLLIG